MSIRIYYSTRMQQQQYQYHIRVIYATYYAA
jgi:hypothetical protein